MDGVIRAAVATDAGWICKVVERAFAPYVGPIGRRPAPMETDWTVEILAGRVQVLPEMGVILAGPSGGGIWEVETVAVAPDVAGRGIGSQLMAASEAAAGAAGCREVSLYTNIAMRGPIRWYPRLGYRVAARRKVDGFDRIYFAKRLTGLGVATESETPRVTSTKIPR